MMNATSTESTIEPSTARPCEGAVEGVDQALEPVEFPFVLDRPDFHAEHRTLNVEHSQRARRAADELQQRAQRFVDLHVERNGQTALEITRVTQRAQRLLGRALLLQEAQVCEQFGPGLHTAGGGVALNIGPVATGNTLRPAAGFTSNTNEM